METSFNNLPYAPQKLPRELKDYYIQADKSEIEDMLSSIGKKSRADLFSHIPKNVCFEKSPNFCHRLNYGELIDHMEKLSKKNNLRTSFIGDGLKSYKIPEIVPFVAENRGLLTAYTPYQPERSQGTLASLYLYSSTLSILTGFEAINSSMYDRSTTLFEALNTSLRLVRKTDTVIVFESIYPTDLEVLNTMAEEKNIKIKTIPINKKTGTTDLDKLREVASSLKGQIASIAFPQVNSLGNLEDVHAVTDLCHQLGILAIAIIDPMLLATGGLVPPSKYGQDESGADMIVGEGQHLCLGPNFGGPGLGIFGIRYNSKNKLSIRQTPGRYVGKGKDSHGNDAYTIVLSTREQHIRREKATSNICSNQAFVATLAGAGILGRGEKGMIEACQTGRKNAQQLYQALTKFSGVSPAFPETPFFNEFTLELPVTADEFIAKAIKNDLHIGVNVGKRTGNDHHLLLTFTDVHTNSDLKRLTDFFAQEFGNQKLETENQDSEIPACLLRKESVNLPDFSLSKLKEHYKELGEQNVSPDDIIYPLGSCTMKYNPYVNEYAANLKGFTDIHPQTPEEDAQGSLEIIYETQEMFKSITGLDSVTTVPLAGAHGEITGIKMFQAYHRNNGEAETRNILLIPHTAHGTNPATAHMAGFETKTINGIKYGIVLVEADISGQIDFDKFNQLITEYNKRIAGIMITNPNTSGLFETKFKEMSDLIHSVGGLVYMDGANMNAIAGWTDHQKMGVDAVHNNLHKTWAGPHGGGGPGAAIVAVSQKLTDFLPGPLVIKEGDLFKTTTPKKSIGKIHRHFGNFANLVKCYTYLKSLGPDGIKEMSSVAVLSAKYLYQKLSKSYPSLPIGAEEEPRMHEFILTVSKETFDKLEKSGTPKALAIAKVGKLFLDFGLHAPTVAFPEIFGLMIEPTETFTKAELDHFAEVVIAMGHMLNETPEILATVPHFTPVGKVDEVSANRDLILYDNISTLPKVLSNKISPSKLREMSINDICKEILKAHRAISS